MAENERRYLLDANILIEAYKRYYGFELCPGFWKAIIRQNRKNRVFSIDRVKKEIVSKGTDTLGREDELSKWARKIAPDTLFKKTNTAPIIEQFTEMVAWVQNQPQYFAPAKEEFARVADGWLIACAKSEGFIVVTDELYNPEIKKKVKIPNVCRHLDVEYLNTFDMLRELDIHFIER